MWILERIAEEKIKAAMEAGEFANLPGRGKPLNLEENPYEARGDWACFRLLRHNDLTLPWIEYSREIEAEYRRLRQALQQAMRVLPDESAWQAARQDFTRGVAALNRRILNYNLQVPSPAFQRRLLNPQTEIQQILASG